MLDRDHASGGEALTVANAVDFVEDWVLGSPGRKKYEWSECTLPFSTVRPADISDLGRDLAAEGSLTFLLGMLSSIDVDLDRLDVKEFHKEI